MNYRKMQIIIHLEDNFRLELRSMFRNLYIVYYARYKEIGQQTVSL